MLDIAARLTIVENPDVQCGMLSWWDLQRSRPPWQEFRESEWTGHACELETSLYLAIDPERVRMELARPDINPRMSPHFWSDLVDQPPPGYSTKVFLTDYWSTVSETGTWGDPTSSTAEKGEAILAAASEELAEIIAELRARPIAARASRTRPTRPAGATTRITARYRGSRSRRRRRPGPPHALQHVVDRPAARPGRARPAARGHGVDEGGVLVAHGLGEELGLVAGTREARARAQDAALVAVRDCSSQMTMKSVDGRCAV